MKRIWLLVLGCVLFSACSDLADTVVTRNGYKVGYYTQDSTRPHAERLLNHLISIKSAVKYAKISRVAGSAHHYRVLVESSFRSGMSDNDKRLAASRIAKTYSEAALNGDTCTLLMYNFFGNSGKVHTTGSSVDPQLAAVVR